MSLPGHMVGHVYYKGEEENEPFVQFLSGTAHHYLGFYLEFAYLDEGLEGQQRLRTGIPRGFRMDGIARPSSESFLPLLLYPSLC